MVSRGFLEVIGSLALIITAFGVGGYVLNENPGWGPFPDTIKPKGRYSTPLPEGVPEIAGDYGAVMVTYQGHSMLGWAMDNKVYVRIEDKGKTRRLMEVVTDLSKGTMANTTTKDGVLDLDGRVFHLIEAGDASDTATITRPKSLPPPK